MIINKTPHDVNIYDGESVVAVFPSEGVARAAVTQVDAGFAYADNVKVPVKRVAFGEVEGLPAPSTTENVVYIVSLITAQCAKAQGRTTVDLLLTNDLVRDEKGQIIGCRSLSRYE